MSDSSEGEHSTVSHCVNAVLFNYLTYDHVIKHMTLLMKDTQDSPSDHSATQSYRCKPSLQCRELSKGGGGVKSNKSTENLLQGILAVVNLFLQMLHTDFSFSHNKKQAQPGILLEPEHRPQHVVKSLLFFLFLLTL